jgi:hypothetical protein
MERILFAWYALGAVCGIMMIVVSLILMIIEPKAEWLLWFIFSGFGTSVAVRGMVQCRKVNNSGDNRAGRPP